MILLGLLQMIDWISTSIGDLVLPALPAEVTNILAYVLTMVSGGMKFCFKVLCNASTVHVIAQWVLLSLPSLFAVDVIWSVLYTITLRRGADETSK